MSDLFGLSVEDATRYLKTVEHPHLTTPSSCEERQYSSELLTCGEHSGVCVKELQFAVGYQVADDECALAYSPEPFSADQIRQLTKFGRREAEDLGGVWGFGGFLLVDDLG
jgi:hypothetical protein